MNVLILNGDLPIFPGRAGHEYLLTTGLARRAERVGVVSLVHTTEQDRGAHGLLDAGGRLYLWRNPDRGMPGTVTGGRRRLAGWAGEVVDALAGRWARRPLDTFVQDRHFRRIAEPLLEALGDGSWQALVVVQSTCARWLDYLPRFPVSVLVMHDVRALVYERRAEAAGTARERRAYARQARRYRRFDREYCRRDDLVITVSAAGEGWGRKHYQPGRLATA